MNYAQAIVNLHPNNEWRSTAPQEYAGNHVGASRFDPAWGETEYSNLQWTGDDPIQPWADVVAEAQRLQAVEDSITQTNAIYAPVEYPQGSGVFYYPRRFSDFETMRASQGRGKLNRAPIYDINGVPQPFATGAELKALVDHIEDTVTARSHAAYDAIFG